MSANLTACEPSPTLAGHTTYTFDMDIPIPSYLLAIVAGNIVSQKIDSRTYVISEPTDIERYAAELSELGVFLDALEEYILNYVWVLAFQCKITFKATHNPLWKIYACLSGLIHLGVPLTNCVCVCRGAE